MKPPKLFRQYAADYHRLFILDIDGVMWASNTYWAMAVPDATHPVARLLALYNIRLVPAVLDVYETITVTDQPAENEKLTKFADVVRTAPDDIEPLEQYTLHGQPLYGFDQGGRRALALYVLPGGRYVALNDKYRRLVERSTPDDAWHGGPDPFKPIYRRNPEGQTTGLLMGVRCPVTEWEPEA